MAHCKIKDAGILDGTVKFIVCVKVYILWTVLKLGD
jgi:hypothetical protein